MVTSNLSFSIYFYQFLRAFIILYVFVVASNLICISVFNLKWIETAVLRSVIK